MPKVQLRKGDVWWGGIDKPFIVSWEAIEETLKAMGIRLVDHFERDERPLPFDPRKLKPYSDDWDQVAIIRVERGQELDVPERVAWWKLTERIARPAASGPEQAAGMEAGEAASNAAEAASQRAAKRRRSTRAGVLAAVLLVSSGVIVPGVLALARRARRRR